jgi:hypothetical protein
MAIRFEELDAITRRYMLEEFETEEASGNPYRGKGLSDAGRDVFPALMRKAIRGGNEISLRQGLARQDYWDHRDSADRRINVA